MSMVVLSVGIVVTFMTLWGVIMVAGFMLGGMSRDSSVDGMPDWVTGINDEVEAPLDRAIVAAKPE